MATERILKLIILIMTLPFYVLSKYFEKFPSAHFHSDLQNCLRLVDLYGANMPVVFVRALIVAEDHRNPLHLGIDPIGMFRAVIVRISTSEIQGASTIEQQFVRVVTGRVERTFRRKFREQLIALALCRLRGKSEISSAYLSIAYFGTGYVGIKGIKKYYGNNLHSITEEQALQFVARLKYPQPSLVTGHWHSKLSRRVQTLKERNQDKHNINFKCIPRLGVRLALNLPFKKIIYR